MTTKKTRITLMMNPELKKRIDYLSLDRDDRYPCDTLEYLVNLGLEKLAEISLTGEVSGGGSLKLAEAGSEYKVNGELSHEQ